MSVQERIYRGLILAYPRQHRRDFGEPMVQLMRDRFRDEGGGWRTPVFWLRILTDVVKSATRERVSAVRDGYRTGWWRAGAVAVAAVIAVADVMSIGEPNTGPWWKWALGGAALLAAPVLIIAGLIVRTRHTSQGSAMVAIGLIPGAFALVLFWSPPFLFFGGFSLAVMVAAINDADRARHLVRPADTA